MILLSFQVLAGFLFGFITCVIYVAKTNLMPDNPSAEIGMAAIYGYIFAVLTYTLCR